MALDAEEFRRRRQARQEARARKKAQQKSLWIKLGIAAAVLVLCAVLILVLATPESSDEASTTQATEQTAPQTTGAPVDENTTVIHIAAAGDLNITESVTASGSPETGYTEAFLDMAPILAQADITAVNLEGSFYGAPYGEDRSAPDSLAHSLSAAGVDLIQLANSYSIYKGMDGLASTVETIRNAGMEPVGAYATAAEAKEGGGYTLRTVRDVKVAFVAFTKGMDGMALPPGNESCVNLLYTDYASDYQIVNTEGITDLLDAVKKEKPDIVVALVHWGSEYNNTVSESQQEICKLLQDNGVDAVIGTHSHYVQQMTLDETTGQFVAYSLGDFFGDADRSGSEYSVILDLEITKDHKSGDTKITGFDYTPIYTVEEEGKPLRLMRIREAMAGYDTQYIDAISQTTYEAMQYALTRIDARIKGE